MPISPDLRGLVENAKVQQTPTFFVTSIYHISAYSDSFSHINDSTWTIFSGTNTVASMFF